MHGGYFNSSIDPTPVVLSQQFAFFTQHANLFVGFYRTVLVLRLSVTLRCYASICIAIMSTTCHGIHNYMCLGCTFNKIKVWKLVLHNML
jgi:hypothetical protein